MSPERIKQIKSEPRTIVMQTYAQTNRQPQTIHVYELDYAGRETGPRTEINAITCKVIR